MKLSLNRTIIGLKGHYHVEADTFLCCLNRTIIGLKAETRIFKEYYNTSLNRTIIGLKGSSVPLLNLFIDSFESNYYRIESLQDIL